MRNPKKIANFILNAYSKRYNLRSPQVAVRTVPYSYELMDGTERYRRFLSFAQRNTFWIGLLVLVTLLSYIAVYYYNLLVDTQQNMLAYRGNVEAILQRRNDIANNLSKAVLDYSAHERGVFTAVVSLRSFMSKDNPEKDDYLKELGQTFGQQKQPLPFEKGALEAAKDENLMSSLSKLMALAEQYPDLKLSSNFQSLMAALIEVEKDLATERIKLNDMVNTYTTNVAKFPCNMFATLYRFPRSPYFEATEEAKAFKLITY